METFLTVTVVLVIILVILTVRELQIADELANFRAIMQPGNNVYYLDRRRGKYYPALLLRVEKTTTEDTMWSIEVYEDDDDYTLITSDLNLFNKKY